MGQEIGNDSIILSKELNDIVITAEKTKIKGKDGAILVDLPSIVKDKPVTNILEALSYLPGVVINNGVIGLTGASNVTIILNGELTNMPIQNLYQLLNSTSVDRLENVEIMYSAPAKYHVNGAVINIKLKTPSALDGLQGQARIGYNHKHYGSYGATLAGTYAIRKWTFDLNYSISRSKTWDFEESFSNHLYDGKRKMIEEDSKRTSRSLSNMIYASTVYKFSEKSLMTLTYNGQITSDIFNQANTYGTVSSFCNDIKYNSPESYHNIALKYISPFGMTIGGDYTSYYENRTQHLSSLDNDKEIAVSTNEQNVNRYHAYIDQAHNIKDWGLNYGVEYQHSDDNSRQTYQLPAQQGFDNEMNEDAVNAYIGLQHSFKWGLSFNASAKGEYYKNNTEHNWNFMPSVNATYSKSPKNIFQLNFNSQRIYPPYWALHGGTTYLNDYSMVIGNPELKPYINYSAQFSYIYKQKYVVTIYYQYSDKLSLQMPYQSTSDLKLVYQMINMDYSRKVGINVNVPFNISYIWNANAMATVYHHQDKASKFHNISFDNKKFVFFGALNNTIKFSQNCPVSLSLDISYVSPSLQGIAVISSMWKFDAGIKLQFGKKRSCELVAKADDIFNKWSPKLTINQSGQDYRMKVHDMTRNFKIVFVWKFNGFKPKNTSIDKSRFGFD